MATNPPTREEAQVAILAGSYDGQGWAASYLRVLAERDRLRERLTQIVGVDPAEWQEGDGWKCVAFLQQIARGPGAGE